MSEIKPEFLGNMNGFTGRSFAGAVWNKHRPCPTLNAMQGGGRQPHIIEIAAVVGSMPQNAFIGNGEHAPTLTDANEIPQIFQKFIYEIDGELYLIRIRKLTPLECWRLMGFTDEDFQKAARVNSNTQLYKQAGNSIVKQVLMAVFSKMFPTKEE